MTDNTTRPTETNTAGIINLTPETIEKSETAPKKKRENRLQQAASTILIVSITLILTILVRVFLLQPVFVKHESMEPTLHNNDLLLLTPAITPHLGDIVVIDTANVFPTQEKSGGLPAPMYVKRLIATGGMTVKEENHTINAYNPDGTLAYSRPLPDGAESEVEEVKIPEGKAWLLGDNYSNSNDSKSLYTVYGLFIPEENIKGTVISRPWTIGNPCWTALKEGNCGR